MVGALLTVLWFVKQHYWFLDVHVGSFHLHTLCKLVLSALVPALLVPGLVTSHAPPSATGALLVFQVGRCGAYVRACADGRGWQGSCKSSMCGLW